MGSKLTKTAVDALKPREKRFVEWDGELAGFGCRVDVKGAKSYIVRYRAGAGGRGAAERLVTIGRHGVITADQARAEAKRLLASVRLGADPGKDRHRERETPSFDVFATAMLDEAAEIARARPNEARLRPGTIRNYKSLLRAHLRSAIGSTKLDAVSQSDLSRLHKKVGKEKPATANRILEFIGSVFKEAARQEIVATGTNPASGIPAFKENRRERFLSVSELVRLGEAIREAETVGTPWDLNTEKPTTKHTPKGGQRTKIEPDAAAALRLLIFTGARLREVLHAKWSDVDLERGLLTVNGKTGRRVILLPAPAAAIISALEQRDTYLFPGAGSTKENPRPRSDLNRPWRTIAKHSGFTDVRLHDLRHSFASFAAAGGASLQIIGKLLGHTQPATTSRYSHLADDPVRVVSDRIGLDVAAALEGKPSAEVISIPRPSRNAS